MKKLVCLLLILTSLFSFAACSTDSTNPSSTSGTITEAVTNNTPSNPQEPVTETVTNNTPSNPQEPVNEKVDFVECLKALLTSYKWNPNAMIPNKLTPEYKASLINANQLNKNYSDFVSVSTIPQNGIGEQWNMVVENLSEAQMFFNVLSLVENLSTVSITTFNNYIDKNPAETAHHQFTEGIYSVTIHCTKTTIDYVLEYTATLPILGSQSVQIALSMNTETQAKNVRVQIGETNALAYTIDQNKYTFAIKYLGVRSALFELVENSDNTITGHIYEYLTVSSIEIASVADFYITDDYVTVVGNKASGIVGFDGYICELYTVSTGEMVAYEVQETLEISGVSVVYNTLWFNLNDIDGITSVKYAPAQSNEEEDKIYVNNKSTAWSAKKYGLSGGTKIASRRFDIEFRTQYFYYYDSANEKYEKIEIQVPMMFIQEEVYNDFVKDVKSENNITVSINANANDLSKLKNEYDSKIDVLKENKEKYSVASIIEYIGNKKAFLP